MKYQHVLPKEQNLKKGSFILAGLVFLAILCWSTMVVSPLYAGTKKRVKVSYSDNAVHPASVKVAKGGRVTWSWNTANPHNVVLAKDTSVRSGDPATSGKYSRTFPKTGTFRFICEVHPSMVTKVKVVK